jgi:primosomal protein N' (replication factor Y)
MTQQQFKYAQVLVNIAKLGTKTFSYLIDDEMKDSIKIGQPVLVPFGNQGVINAFVVGFSNYLPEHIKAKKIYEILDETPAFDLEYLSFIDWISRYYCCDIQTVFACAVPSNFFAQSKRIVKLLKEELPQNLSAAEKKLCDELLIKREILSSTLQKKLKLPSSKFYDVIRKLKKQDIIAIESEIVSKTAKTKLEKIVCFKSNKTENARYKKILDELKSNDNKPLSLFIKNAKTTLPTIKKLEAENFLEIKEKEVYRNPLDILNINEKDDFPRLNEEQEKAFDIISTAIQNGETDPILLHGITGSEKQKFISEQLMKSSKKVRI